MLSDATLVESAKIRGLWNIDNGTRIRALEDERDEWKRRAEAAEEQARLRTGDIPTAELRDVPIVLSDAGRLEKRKSITERRASVTLYGVDYAREAERGPGIAAMPKPDNERWGPSDVDRLCDDAD